MFRLVAEDDNLGGTFIDDFRFPSGCICNKINLGVGSIEV